MSWTDIKCWRPVLLGAALPLGGLAAWWWAASTGQGGPLFVSPRQFLDTAATLGGNGELWQALLASLGRYLLGLGVGVAAGLVAGLLLGLSDLSRRLLGPTLRTLQQVSLFAWIPLIMAWFGLAETSKLVFIALAAFFPVLVNTFEGVGSVPAPLVEVSRVLQFNGWQLLGRVVLPAALPSIFSGLYLALIYGWMATLGAEYLLTSGKGLGNLLAEGQDSYRMDRVLLGVVLVACVGFALNALASRLEAHLQRWKNQP